MSCRQNIQTKSRQQYPCWVIFHCRTSFHLWFFSYFHQKNHLLVAGALTLVVTLSSFFLFSSPCFNASILFLHNNVQWDCIIIKVICKYSKNK
ncbi:hypothetical protein Hanom_Chr04g00343361 [Helianthus anomalus]